MPVIFPVLTSSGVAQSASPQVDQVAYALGVNTRVVTFSTPFADTTYRIAFNLGTGVAIPIITVTGKATTGFTYSFTSITSGTALAIAVA